jgi:RNA polymerase sigma-70 factor (ECF subfamily)
MTADDLLRNHLDPLFRYACRLTGSVADAEDLVQETFLIVTRKIGDLREPDRARPWLLQILRRCWMRQRRRALPIGQVRVEEIEAAQPGDAPGVGDVDADRLMAVLNALPDDYREPLLLFYFEELRYREIAEVLHVPVGTVMSRIARGKAYLRERLSSTVDAAAGRADQETRSHKRIR